MIVQRLGRMARIAVLRVEAVTAMARVRRRGPFMRYAKARMDAADAREPAGAAAVTDDIAAAVAFAARLPRTTCVDRATVLWGMLQRRGLPARMRIGYRYAGSAFEAHAWVECGGRAFGDVVADGRPYRPFDDAVVPRSAQ